VAGDVADVVIGGDLANRIAGNRGFGVGISSHGDSAHAATTPRGVQVIGNEIWDTAVSPAWPDAPGLAIDLFAALDTTVPFHPLDASPEQRTGLGPGVAPGVDGSAPNLGVGAPVVTSTELAGDRLTVELDLDLDEAAAYRVDVYLGRHDEPGAARVPTGHARVERSGRVVLEFELPDGIGSAAAWSTVALTRLDVDGGGSTGELSAASAVVRR
jgi:hypothetical protein